MIDVAQDILIEYVIPIGIAFLVAWIVHRLTHYLAEKRGVSLIGYVPPGLRVREERRRTLNDLTASLISFLVFLTATVFSLARFIEANTLIWMVGLFSAAFGLGARPLIADFLTGLSFMIEDAIQIGEKVEILDVIGTVERINLRTTMIRAQTGELFVIPNGEVRVVRNFSRGKFSSSEITIRVPAESLPQVRTLLDDLSEEAAAMFPDLMEPWRIISQTGVLSQHVELTLVIQARFGHAADLRVTLLSFLQQRLAEAKVTLAA